MTRRAYTPRLLSVTNLARWRLLRELTWVQISELPIIATRCLRAVGAHANAQHAAGEGIQARARLIS